MDAKTQIAISILTILASGGIATLIVHFLGARLKERDFRRHKLEELYQHSVKYCMSLTMIYAPYLDALKGNMSPEQLAKLTNNSLKMTGHDPEKIAMLISIYFPSVLPAYNDLTHVLRSLSHIHTEYNKSIERRKNSNIDMLNDLEKALLNLTNVQKKLTNSIVDEGNKINQMWWKLWKPL